MTAPRRAIFLINSLAGGGAERVMCTLLRYSEPMRSEFQITLALLDQEPAAYAPPDWVELRQLDGRRSLPRSIVAVGKLYAELKPDVTLSFLSRANIANIWNAKRGCVISERSNTSAHLPGLRGAPARALVRLAYPRADKVIAVSQGVADDLVQNFGLAPGKLETIANPVDAAAIAQRAAEAPTIDTENEYLLAVGRLVRSKNFELLIRAYAASGLAQRLVILGEGPERDNLERLIAELSLSDRVSMPGFAANPYPIMARAALFVLSSNDEGFPNALVEAMTLGVPVVATNCASGPSEILADSAREIVSGLALAQYGALTPTDDVASMAEALRLMSDPERRRDYGARAAARARTYSPEAAAERYWRVLREAMA
ncbi:MAG: glycosyltransferase [Alphaproteobacteria bacterium]|nr:MAG: glycosyltransferase [Alphaproteobacteria bacterium]